MRPLHLWTQQPARRGIDWFEKRLHNKSQQVNHMRIYKSSVLHHLPYLQRVLHRGMQSTTPENGPTPEPLQPQQHHGPTTEGEPTSQKVCKRAFPSLPFLHRQQKASNRKGSF